MSKFFSRASHGQDVIFGQLKYPSGQYKCEVEQHARNISEYFTEITEAMHRALEMTMPNVKNINRQPHITPSSRAALVGLALTFSRRLRLLPYVIFRAVRLFDRYCSKRVVVFSQSSLVMAACVWIAAKLHGGNCHFAMKPELDTHIVALGFGSGSRLFGPTQRYRYPRTKEILSCLTSECCYEPSDLHAMEIAVLSTLDWNLSEPGIEDFLICSSDLNVTSYVDKKYRRPVEQEFSRMKKFIAYAVCFSEACIPYDVSEVATVICDIVNETFITSRGNSHPQTPQLNQGDNLFNDSVVYDVLHKHIVSAVVNAPRLLLAMFTDRGPQALHTRLVCLDHKQSMESSRVTSSLSSAQSSPATPGNPKTQQVVFTPATPENLIYDGTTKLAHSVRENEIHSECHLKSEKMASSANVRSVIGMHTPSYKEDELDCRNQACCPTGFTSKVPRKVSLNPEFYACRYTDCDKTTQRSNLGICTPATEESSHKSKRTAITEIASKIFRRI